MEELHLHPFSFSVADRTERAVSTLHIVPKVTVETTVNVWDIQGFEKSISKFLKALDNLLSQNREEQVERGSFKIMRNI